MSESRKPAQSCPRDDRVVLVFGDAGQNRRTIAFAPGIDLSHCTTLSDKPRQLIRVAR